MRKSIIGAAALVGGLAIGSVVAPPMAALAADNTTTTTAAATARTPGQWVTDALKGLVDKGTLTQAQSDEVATALKDAKPEGGPGRGGHGGPGGAGPDTAAVASVLGLSETDLRTQAQTKCLADIAKEKNVDVQKVIDALVAAENTRLDKEVTDGRITQAQADERKAKTTERVTERVNNVRPAKGPGGGGPRGDRNGTAPAPSTTTSTTTPTTTASA